MGTPYSKMTPEQKQRSAAAKKRWSVKNQDKIAVYKRKHYADNRDKYLTIERNRSYQKLYGITIEDYDRMLLAQDGKCHFCGSTSGGRGGRCFAVDHDHVTGKVRGLLCASCNVQLGWYERHKDKVEGYLKETGT